MSQIITPHVMDVTEQTFQADVIEHSKMVPVVVDFWAAWCGPCHTLGPVLERLAAEYDGQFRLAKVDVDQNQRLSQQYRVQGIPAVKAFFDGKVVGEFTGAQPESQVRQFLRGLIPSQADKLAKQGYTWEMSGQLKMALTNYRGALDEDGKHYHAMIGLGRTLLKTGEIEEASDWLNKVPQGLPERQVAEALLATAEFRREAAGKTEADLKAAIEADGKDVASRYALACLYAAEQNYEAAMNAFLNVIRLDRTYKDDGARKAMLALFTAIGAEHELTRKYQRKLANALF